MALFPTASLDALADYQTAAYRDVCAVQAWSEGSPDAGGEYTPTWANVSGLTAVPCSVLPQPATEAIRAEQIDTRQRYLVKMDVSITVTTSTVTTKHRLVVASGPTLEIESVVDVQRLGRWLQILAVANADGGA